MKSIDDILARSTDMVNELMAHADQGKIEVILEQLAAQGFPEIGAVYHLGMLYLLKERS